METPQRKINEKSEYSILHDEEFILLTDSRLIKDKLFHTFSVNQSRSDLLLHHVLMIHQDKSKNHISSNDYDKIKAKPI